MVKTCAADGVVNDGRPGLDRRRLLGALAGGAAAGWLAGPLRAQPTLRYFTIATGSVAGTYYPVGGLLSDIISSPPGARGCEVGGSCGVSGLMASALTSQGSAANLHAISRRRVDSGLAQSDIIYMAYNGTELFAGQAPMTELRVIASLYPETLHIVVREGLEVDSPADLAGKRIAIGQPGSGTLYEARRLLAAYDLSEEDLDASHEAPAQSLARMREGRSDGFIFVAGHPTPSVTEAVERLGARLLSIGELALDRLISAHPFLDPMVIPSGTYGSLPQTVTIAVGAQWVVHAAIDAELVYGITEALWHPSSQIVLREGHAVSSRITLDTALDGVTTPLHPGAARYYREHGVELPPTRFSTPTREPIADG